MCCTGGQSECNKLLHFCSYMLHVLSCSCVHGISISSYIVVHMYVLDGEEQLRLYIYNVTLQSC